MITKYIYRSSTLTSTLFRAFSKRKNLPFHKEPVYYKPFPQALPSKILQEIKNADEKKFDRLSLHPHAYWITQGKGTERPFTGRYWDTKELGRYNCVVCANKLFLSDHKFFPPTGMASFWNSIKGGVEVTEDVEDVKGDNVNLTTKLYDNETDKKRVVCAKCKSHVGTLHHDGPPPTFKRYSINSGAMVFTEKPWFHPPEYYRKVRKDERRQRNSEKFRAELIKKRTAKFKVDMNQVREIEEKAKLPERKAPASKNEGQENAKKLQK